MESTSEAPQESSASVVPKDIEQGASAVTSSETTDLCWICAEPVKYYALSECNHKTCHVCALRLRALYKKVECTFCKVRYRLVVINSRVLDFWI